MEYIIENKDWLKAVIENDVAAVEYLLTQSSEDARYLLLEGWICEEASFWDGWPHKEAETQKIMSVHRTLSLAAVCGSCDVIDVLHSADINMFQIDKRGNNVIHTLIIHANRSQEREETYLEVFNKVESLMSTEKFKKLLVMENSSGITPLELATHFQTFRLMNAILTNPGQYLKKQTLYGKLSIDSYDVTDYESESQCRPWVNSPMFLLIFLRSTKLKDRYTTKMLTSGLIYRWLSIRKQIYLPFVILWTIIRIWSIFLSLFPASLNDPTNPELRVCGAFIPVPHSVRISAIISLIIIATFALLYDIYDIIKINLLDMAWMKTYSPVKGSPVVQYVFYRVQETTLNIVILIMCLNRIMWYLSGPHLPIYPEQMLFVVLTINSVWSLLQFVQLVPVIGCYVMATQRMVLSLAKFAVVILIFVLPFSFIFPKFILERADGTCPEEFNSTISSFYTSFTIILNMVNFRSFDTPCKESLWLIHVFYITFVAILLLNFLIAIFLDSYTEIANYPEILTNIQWLSILATVDFRIPGCMRCIVDRRKRRYFLYRDDRIYVQDFRCC